MEHAALNGILGYLTLSVFFSDLISSLAREICPFSSAVFTKKLFPLPLVTKASQSASISLFPDNYPHLLPYFLFFQGSYPGWFFLSLTCLHHHYFSHRQRCQSKIHLSYLSSFSCTKADKYCSLIQKQAPGNHSWDATLQSELKANMMETEQHKPRSTALESIPGIPIPSAIKEMPKSSRRLDNTKH